MNYAMASCNLVTGGHDYADICYMPLYVLLYSGQKHRVACFVNHRSPWERGQLIWVVN